VDETAAAGEEASRLGLRPASMRLVSKLAPLAALAP